MTETEKAASVVDNLQREREAVRQRASGCPHELISESEPRPFTTPVAERRSGSEYNPAAHGNIVITATCRRCGSYRHVAINGLHREISGWHTPFADLDARIDQGRRRLEFESALDAAEARSWRGNELRVHGAAPVRVEISPYEGGEYVQLALDGERRCWSLADILSARENQELDSAQRLAWALIYRRAVAACRRA